MIHLTNTITALVDEWNANGFNGVRFEQLYLEKSQREPSEETQKQYEKRLRDYAIFFVNPRLMTMLESSHEYETVDVDEYRFNDDMIKEVKRRCGRNVLVRFAGDMEIEVQRVKS